MGTRRFTVFSICLLLAGALSIPAIAGFVTIRNKPGCTAGLCLSAQGLDSAKNTGWEQTLGFRALTYSVAFTDANDSVTAVVVECEATHDASTTLGSGFEICSGATAAGVTTMTCPHQWSHTTGTAEAWIFTVDNLNMDYVNCIFTATGVPAAADVVTVRLIKKTP